MYLWEINKIIYMSTASKKKSLLNKKSIKYTKKKIDIDSDSDEEYESEDVCYSEPDENNSESEQDNNDSQDEDFEEDNDDSEKDDDETKEDNDFENKELNETDIRNIIFKDIDDIYAYGKLGKFNVMIIKNNGYINATKLCKDGKKEFFNWYKNKDSKELIDELKSSLHKRRELLIFKNMKGKYITRGTYVHPELIIHIASWCSGK